jgi:hypothetical protein
LQRWGLDRHIEAYERLFQLLLYDHLQDPEFRQGARTLNIDGSVVRSRYTIFERVHRKTGENLPPTIEGGGFMKRTESNHGKMATASIWCDHDFNGIASPTGSPLWLLQAKGRLTRQ